MHRCFTGAAVRMFYKIGVLKNVRNIHKKTTVLESLFNKIAGLSPVTLLNKRLQTWYSVIDAPTLVFQWMFKNALF